MRGWLLASVQAKLTAVTMATCLAALLLAGVGITTYELVNAREVLALQLASRADLIGATSTAAVQFRDVVVAGETLAAFAGDQDVEAARIDLADGTTFTRYVAGPAHMPADLPVDGTVQLDQSIVVSRAIMLDGERIGTIHVQGSLERAHAQVVRYLGILIGVLGASCLLAYLLSRALQRVISGPIIRLAAVATRVSSEKNYSVRAEKESEDETGLLVDRFNEMLSQIQRRDEELRTAQSGLEARVRERTKTLELEVLEHQRTENQLTLAKAAAEEASVAKSAFLANMSHELRTPLNAIIGYGEMLQEDAQERGDATVVGDLTRITSAGRHLLALITNVLDLSKIEAGRMDLHSESFEVAAILRDVIATGQALALANDNRLEVVGLDALGYMHSDPTKLRQVLMNLLSNACKFTRGGDVRVDCRRERRETGDRLAVLVSDSGIGMTPEQVGRLFSEFMQADASTTRTYGGTGLGLAISQRLAQLMGGALTASSEFGKGATFRLDLPVGAPVAARRFAPDGAARDAASISAVEGFQPPSDAHGRSRVLVIDDDSTARDLARRALEKAGFLVVRAESATEGLRLARQLRPEVVIVDVLMPGMTGWEVLSAIKSDEATRHIPVVVVSIVDERRQSLAIGAIDHLLKPVVPDQLVEVVRSAMGLGETEERVSA